MKSRSNFFYCAFVTPAPRLRVDLSPRASQSEGTGAKDLGDSYPQPPGTQARPDGREARFTSTSTVLLSGQPFSDINLLRLWDAPQDRPGLLRS